MIKQQLFLLALLVTLIPQHAVCQPETTPHRTGSFSIKSTAEQLLGAVSEKYQHALASVEEIV